MPRNMSHSVVRRSRSPFASLTRFSLLATLTLLLLGVLPAQSSFVNAQTGPNGKIAFVSDRDGARDIYTMNVDGSNVTRLTNLGECDGPVWSPDGNRIAFTHVVDGYSKIYRINADGTGLSLLYIPEAFPAHQRNPKWSPDGTKITFSHEGPNFEGVFQQDIVVMDATTGYTLANYSFDQAFFITHKDTNPVWSPDGKKIAYLRDFGTHFPHNQIIVLDLTTETRTQVTDNEFSCTAPVWSPDSTRLAFTRAVGVASFNRITVINADGSNPIAPAADSTSLDAHPVWSPDGTKIAFEHSQNDLMTGERLSGGIAVASPNTLLASLVETVNGADFAPSWSPDSSRVTFAGSLPTNDQTEQSEIFAVDANGDNSAQLTNVDTLDDNPVWQPTQVDNTPAGANVTVNYGQIKLTFENIVTPGQTSIQLLDANSFNSSLPSGYLLHNNHAYEITTTATFTGPVTISFELFTITYPEDLAKVRVLHGENGTLVDRTILAPDQPAPQYDPNGSTVYARVTSLSPFVIADLGSAQDQTAPTVTATIMSLPSDAGWYNSDTFVLLKALDNVGGSGVASITYAINGGGGGGSDFSGGDSSLTGGIVVNSSEVYIPVTTEGTTTITYLATDNADNSSPEQTVMLQLDKTAPNVSITTPTEGAVYTQNQVVKANYNCTDALSGINTCAGTTANGSNLDTASPGTKSFVVTATDNAGNMTEQIVNYTVQGSSPSSCATDVTNRVNFDANDLTYDKRTRRYSLKVTITNKSATAIQGPVSLVIDHLSDYGITLANMSGVTTCAAPLGSPYINLNVGSDGVLKRNEKVTVTLISDPTDKKNGPYSPTVQPRVLAGNGTR